VNGPHIASRKAELDCRRGRSFRISLGFPAIWLLGDKPPADRCFNRM
jgi:hypothetical protein